MKKIKYICDKCFTMVGFQITVVNEELETHLFPIGHQEWCYKCLMSIAPDILMFGEKNKITEEPLEIGKYGKI